MGYEDNNMRTFNQIYKEVEKLLKGQPEPVYSDIEVNSMVNKAIDELHRVCIICGKKFKNYRGVIIHSAKMHKKEYKLAKMDKWVRRYGQWNGKYIVRWDKQNK